jgi:hypothetical protein
MEEKEYEKYFRKFEEVYERDGFGCWLPTNERKLQLKVILEEVEKKGATDNYQEAYDDGLKDGLYK